MDWYRIGNRLLDGMLNARDFALDAAEATWRFIRRHWKLLFIKLPIALAVLLVVYTVIIYVQWRADRPAALEKLSRYKQLIDRTEELRSGTVYSTGDIDISRKVVDIPTRIYDRNGEVIGEFFEQKREIVPFASIPKDLVNAVIASEDRDFYEHSGVNPKGIFRAMLINMIHLGFRQGGSTITQQLAKNFFTDMDRSLKRKIYELFCAREIEKQYDKQDIMAMYLNLIYFGNGAYGVESVSKMYFGTGVSSLTTAECSMIVATISNPLYYSPMTNLDNSVKKTRRIMASLTDDGKLTEKKADYLYRQFLAKWDVKFDEKKKAKSSLIGSFIYSNYRVNRAPFFNEYIRRILADRFGEESVKGTGLSVYTTIDARRQDLARASLREGIAKQREWYRNWAMKQPGTKRRLEEIENSNTIDGAFVSIDPATGAIIAYEGGYEFTAKSQLDHAAQIRRQPGSSFKPFIYCAAIEDGEITPGTVLEDRKVNFGGWSPSNYSGSFAGPVTVHTALVRSINTIAVQVLDLTGYDILLSYLAKGLDLSNDELDKRFKKTLSMALGTYELSPLENATLHAMLVNGGQYVKPWGIRYVKDYNGATVWNNEEEMNLHIQNRRNEYGPIINPQAAAVTVNMLKYVLRKGGTAEHVGQGYRLSFPVAGKTGTSTNWNDAWFAGYTADSASAVWIGNSKGSISLGRHRSGGALSAPVWGRYIAQAYPDAKPGEFQLPDADLTAVSICLDSGKLVRDSNFCPHIAVDELFVSGTEPTDYCDIHTGFTETPVDELPREE